MYTNKTDFYQNDYYYDKQKLTCSNLPLATAYVRPQSYKNLNSPFQTLKQGTFLPIFMIHINHEKYLKEGVTMNKEGLLRKLQALNLIAVDLQLFLDTHPGNKEALEDYRQVTKQYQKLREDYEYEYGPLTNFGYMTSFDQYSWVNDPWPWEQR